jgi:hypothetical protein
MMSHRNVILDFDRGLALVGVGGGQAQVAIDLTTAGELRVGGPDGPLLRPLSFGLRSRLVLESTVAPRPVDAVCAALRQTMIAPAGNASGGDLPPEMIDLLALHLAGADEPGAPPFAEAARLVAQTTGWGPAELSQADALLVDQLAAQFGESQPSSGWRRFLLGGGSSVDFAAMRNELAENLLRRAQVESPRRPVTPGATPTERPAPASPTQTHRSPYVLARDAGHSVFPGASQQADETPTQWWEYVGPASGINSVSGATTTTGPEKRNLPNQAGAAQFSPADAAERRLKARWHFQGPSRSSLPDRSPVNAAVTATSGAAGWAPNDAKTVRAGQVAAPNEGNAAHSAAMAHQSFERPYLGLAHLTHAGNGPVAQRPDGLAVPGQREPLSLATASSDGAMADQQTALAATLSPVIELAEELAALLHEEADLRGLQR